MMITVTNYKGDSLVLSPSGNYLVDKITGLGPMSGTISTQKMAQHGTVYNGATTDERNIVIKLRLAQPVAANRQALYDFFPTALPVTLHFQTANRDCTISGYTEQNEPDSFIVGPTAQLSIICPDPFFRASELVFEPVDGIITVPSSCPYESGYELRAVFSEAADSFALTNEGTGETLTVNHAFAVGDVLLINTDERTIRVNGVNCFNDKAILSPWAMLRMGNNQLTPSAGADVQITFADKYIGI